MGLEPSSDSWPPVPVADPEIPLESLEVLFVPSTPDLPNFGQRPSIIRVQYDPATATIGRLREVLAKSIQVEGVPGPIDPSFVVLARPDLTFRIHPKDGILTEEFDDKLLRYEAEGPCEWRIESREKPIVRLFACLYRFDIPRSEQVLVSWMSRGLNESPNLRRGLRNWSGVLPFVIPMKKKRTCFKIYELARLFVWRIVSEPDRQTYLSNPRASRDAFLCNIVPGRENSHRLRSMFEQAGDLPCDESVIDLEAIATEACLSIDWERPIVVMEEAMAHETFEKVLFVGSD